MSNQRKQTKSRLIRIALALTGLIGLWLLGFWTISAPTLNASNALPELVFQSIIPTPPIDNPILSVVKSVDNDSPSPGDIIEYTLTYSSTSPGSQAFHVRLYDFLPAGVEFQSASPPATYDNGTVLFTDNSVGPVNETATVRARVKEGYSQIHNYAVLMADLVHPGQTSLLTTVEQPPSWLKLTKDGNTAVLVSREIIYTLYCENTSGVTVHNATVKDVLPDGTSLVGANPPPDPDSTPPVLTWSLGDLGPDESRTVVLTVTAPSSSGTITNVAMADAQRRVMTHTIFATQIVTQGAILDVTKQGSANPVDVGDQLVYTLRYSNIGNQTATNVKLTDTLPANVSVTDIYSTATLISSDPLVWDIGTLATDTVPGEIIITVTIDGGYGQTIHNRADITAPGSYPDHAESATKVRLALLYLPLIVKNF